MACLNGARLQMLEKGEDKVVREIPVRTSQVQIGSNPTKNTVRLNSAGVEEFHCKIFVKNDKVFIANYSAQNPISVDQTVVPKRAALNDGSVLEICGTRFRWKFDDSKLVRSEKARKTERTPTSSKFGSRRRTTLARKKQSAAVAAAAAGGSGKKPAAKKATQQKTPTYTLPKNHKQLMKNIRKRFTVHNIMTRQNSEDGADEEDMECEDSGSLVEHQEPTESPKPVTPQKSSSTTSSVANTPFYTPEPEKENSVPVSKTPKTPMLQLENSAMMILSYTPAIGSRSKANIQKTPISAAKSVQRLNYLTPKNENVSVSGTPQKSKAGNSMYLIDLTTPNSGHSSFVCSPMHDTSLSSVGSAKVGMIDLTTPSPKLAKTPASALKSTQQKTLLKSALKNASRTPRTALRTATGGTPATPKTVPKIRLNDTPTRSATSTRSNKTPAGGTPRVGSIRSKLETPISSKKQPETVPTTPTVAQPELTESKDASIMTTDELFDTLVGRQSAVKTYERKSTSPKKTPCPLVLAEDTSDMPKTDIDLWVESVVAAVTSPEPVNMDAIIRKPNQTTQVRSSQYSDITPHESFAEGTATSASTSDVIEPQPESVTVDENSPDALDNMTDKPTIPNSSRRSETPLASKIARSLGTKRQTIGNFFTNIFGKLTVSPVTRISIANDSTNQPAEEEEPTNVADSDGSEEVYHDSETSHAADVPPEQPAEESMASSPKLRQSLRDTRKFIGNAWTSLNTSRPQLDNTAEIDESLLLSDTYNETQPDAPNDSATDEVYDLTDLGSRPVTAQPPMSAAKTPTHRQSVQSTAAFDISPLATPLESTPPNKSVVQDLARDETGSFVISPDVTVEATPLPSTPVSRRSLQNATPTTTSDTTSRRSTRRQTLQPPTESVDASIAEQVDHLVVESAESDVAEDASQVLSCSPKPLEQSIRTSPNQSMNDQVNEVEPVSGTLDQTNSVEGMAETVDEPNSEEQVISDDLPANSTSLAHLDTSEMEPLEVTDGHESESEVAHPGTPPSKDLVGSRRATRNSIATIQAVTPKVAAATVAKIPLSDSKLPVRGLRKTASLSPAKTVNEPTPETNVLEDSTTIMDNVEQVVQTEFDSAAETEEPSSSLVDQVDDIESGKREDAPCDELSLPQADPSSTPLEVSQTTVDTSLKSANETTGHCSAVDSTADLEQSVAHESFNLNATARRSTRKSLATMTVTPKANAESSLSTVAMSESKLPLRRLRATEMTNLEQTVEETSTTQALEDSNTTSVEPETGDSSTVEEAPHTPSTSKEADQSVKGSPSAKTIPASPGRSSRSSARSTPQRAVSSTPKSMPSGAAPLLKRVLQKVATATATSAPSPKPELNESEPDASLQLDQLYQTPPSRVTRGKASKTSTPNIADASLNLDELYKTPARATRGNVETPDGHDDESTPKGVDNLFSTPVQSATTQHDLSEVKLESSAVDKSLNLQELYKTPVKALPSQLPEVAKSPRGSATPTAEAEMRLNIQQVHLTPPQETVDSKPSVTESEPDVDYVKVELDSTSKSEQNVDMSLNLQELYKTPARVLRTNAQLSALKTSETPKEIVVQADVSLNLQQLYKTPARSTRQSSAARSTITVVKDVDVSKAEADEIVDPQPNANMSLNLQELYKTPAKGLSTNAQVSVQKKLETPKVEAAQADVSLNLQQLYKTPARSTRLSSAVKSTPDINASKAAADEIVVLQPNANMSLNLQELTPAKAQQSAAKNSDTAKEAIVQADVSLNLQQLYKTPARPTRQSSMLKSTPQSSVVDDVSKVENEPARTQPAADVTLNLQELCKTPIRAMGSSVHQSAVKKSATSKVSVAQDDVRLVLPARSTRQSSVFESTPQSAVHADVGNVDVSLNLQDMYKTPARPMRASTAASTPSVAADVDDSRVEVDEAAKLTAVNTPEALKESVVQAEESLNLQQLYTTPARATRQSSAIESSPQVSVTADVSKTDVEPLPSTDLSMNMQELDKTNVEADEAVDQQSNANLSLNLQELSKTPAKLLSSNVQQSAQKKSKTPKVEAAQADVSLNLQQIYKTPARSTRQSLAITSNAQVTDSVESPTTADITLKLQEMHQTPVRTLRTNAHQSATPSESTDRKVELDANSGPAQNVDLSLNLQELYKTPARTLRTNTQLSAIKTSETPKETVVQADLSLNLQQLYKTPARSTRQSSAVKSTPKSTEDADVSKVEAGATADMSLNLQELYNTPAKSVLADAQQQSTVENSEAPLESVVQADVSLNLQELYKTPARTLPGVSQLTPAPKQHSTPAAGAVQPVPEADLSLNLEQLYKTPARTLRGTTQLSAVKPGNVSKVTPQKVLVNSTLDVTPTAAVTHTIERTPIAKVSEPEADMTLNLDQMYQTPARQFPADEKVGSTAKAEADVSLNIDKLYTTPAQTLRGVTQLALSTPSTEPKAEAEMSLNLQELYKTPARTLRASTQTHQATAKEAKQQESADVSLNLQTLYKTPSQTQQAANTTLPATADESNPNVESLFKTPARTTRGRLPQSSAKVTPKNVTTPLRTSRSASKGATRSAAVQEQPSVSMIESELASSIVGESSMDIGSESDGLLTGKAITSSTPFNARTRKSTLVAAVGMMSPLNSSGDATMTSEMHTEAIGITTIDRSAAADSTTTAVDQMQTMAGVFVAEQSRLLYDESGMGTLQGDPLQVTNAVEEDITCTVEVDATKLNETTQRTVAESLLEQNGTMIEATLDTSKVAEQSIVSTTTADNDVEETIHNSLYEADVSTLARTSQSSAVEDTPVRNVVEPETDASIHLQTNELASPARMPQGETAQPAGTPLNASAARIVVPEVVQNNPLTSPKQPATPATGSNKSASGTPTLMSTRLSTTRLSTASTNSRQSTPLNASKQRVSVTVNISINQHEPAVSALPEEPTVKTPVAEGMSASDVSVIAEPTNASSLVCDKLDDESIPEQSAANLSAVLPENRNATSNSVATTKEPDVAAAYLDALGVDPVLLQQIHDRVDTLERELAEINDQTVSNSMFLERSDEQSLESEVEGKLQDNTQTPRPMRRRLYTKIAPDESTPEHRESIGDQRVTSFYTESDSDRKAADTSTEAEEPKRVEPVKVLPSRASRRKITTLSEEALAGASPELKFVKPKQPKVVVVTEDPPQVDTSVNTSEAEQSDQETSLGRRKVVFNDQIQVKEINSPAFIGEIIKKTTLRGRGRNNKQAVTVTVDQHVGQSIKPATKRGKAFEAEAVAEVAAQEERTSTGAETDVASERVESVEPIPEEPAVDEVPKPSEEIEIKPSGDEPAAKRNRARKAPATKRTGSRQKITVKSATEDEAGADAKDPQEEASTVDATEAALDKVETVSVSEVDRKDPVVEELTKPSEEIVDEQASKRSRVKKAPATKRAGSRKKEAVESTTQDEVEVAPAQGSEAILDKFETVENEGAPNALIVDEPAKLSEEIDEASVGEPAAKRSRTKRAPVTKRAGSRKKAPVESTTEDDEAEADPKDTPERATSLEDVPDKAETAEAEVNPKDSVAENLPKQSEEIDEPATERSRSKKALTTKRVGSRKNAPVESTTEDEVDPQEETSTAKATKVVPDKVEASVEEPPKQSEEIVETSVDEPTARRGRAKKATAATKQTGSKTKVDGKEEQTSTTSEGKDDESGADAVKPSAKRSRRGAKTTSDDTEPVVNEPTVEVEEKETEQKVDEPITKRVRHAHESSTASAVETPVEDQTNKAEERDDAQTKVTTKATSRARRGKKQAPTKSETVQTESEVPSAEAEQAVPKSTETKPRSRRGGRKNDSPIDAVVDSDFKEPEAAAEKANATVESQKDSQTEEKAHETTEEISTTKAKPRSRRGAKGKTAPAAVVVQEENSPAEDQETGEVTSSVVHEEEQESVSHSKAAANRGTRRGRGTARNDTVEPSDVSEAAASLAVEKSIADSTSRDEPSSDVAVVDVKSGAKRSRRGAAKDEAEPGTEAASVEQVTEPASKRSRRLPKSKPEQVTETAQAEAEPKTTGRSRRGQKQEAIAAVETDSIVSVEKPSTEGNQETSKETEVSKVEESESEAKTTSRGRGTKKKAAEEHSSARMPSPTLPPPAVDEQPAKRTGRQATRRAPKKASNPDPVSVEMSMNESHMVKTMLPASHTSTPLIKNTLNADTSDVPSGSRGRRAATNPVIAALIEESTPRTRGRRGASATPADVQVETPNTPAKRGRGRGAAAKAKAVEEETQSSTVVVESEPSTSTAPSRGKKAAKANKEVIEEDEPVVEVEPATKRTRKVPAKLRDDADDVKSTRGRRGAKATTEDSNAAAVDEETTSSSAGPSKEEPKRKARTAAAKRTVKKKAADLSKESVPEEKAEEEEAPKSPPPKRTRKGAR